MWNASNFLKDFWIPNMRCCNCLLCICFWKSYFLTMPKGTRADNSKPAHASTYWHLNLKLPIAAAHGHNFLCQSACPWTAIKAPDNSCHFTLMLSRWNHFIPTSRKFLLSLFVFWIYSASFDSPLLHSPVLFLQCASLTCSFAQYAPSLYDCYSAVTDCLCSAGSG